MNAYQFFYANAGYSYGPGETQAQGHRNSAKAYAAAEAKAKAQGYSYEWTPHDQPNEETGNYDQWGCIMHAPDGSVVASLWGIDFGEGKEPWGEPYRRVVEAELACEALS